MYLSLIVRVLCRTTVLVENGKRWRLKRRIYTQEAQNIT